MNTEVRPILNDRAELSEKLLFCKTIMNNAPLNFSNIEIISNIDTNGNDSLPLVSILLIIAILLNSNLALSIIVY